MARFFDTNYLFENFGGSFNASSSSGLAFLSFDEDRSFSWTSNGEGTDGTSIFLERILDTPISINRVFAKETNISNLTIEVDIGAGYITLNTASNFNLIKSNNGENYFYELDNSISISKIKFIGSNTIIPNQEKTIKQCYAFMELGIIANNDDIQPKRVRLQAITKLNSGKVDIVNKGISWSFKLKLRAHYKQSDNEIINTVLQRGSEVWLWINNNQEDSIVMLQEPYRFSDLYKVTFQKADSVRFNSNMFFSGIDVTFNLVEVA